MVFDKQLSNLKKDDVVKVAKLFCRWCKVWTNQVLVFEADFHRYFICLKCGNMISFHSERYCHIEIKEIKIPLGDGEERF